MNKLSELHSEYKKMIITDFNRSYDCDIEHGEELNRAVNEKTHNITSQPNETKENRRRKYANQNKPQEHA